MKNYITVSITFQRKGGFETIKDGKAYTYRSSTPLRVDDLVVVPLGGNLKVGCVKEVHNTPQDTEQDITYLDVFGTVTEIEGVTPHA